MAALMDGRNSPTPCVLNQKRELPPGKLTAVVMLEQLHRAGGGLTEIAAISYLEELREDRKRWRAADQST